MRSRMLWVAAFAGLVAMMLPAATLGQTQNGELNGRVRDPDGLSLPGVTITLTEAATGYTRTTVSSGDGAYVIPNLRPGTYDVSLEVQGFKTINQTGLILSSGAELTINYDLELATIEEVVTVTAETPLVEVTSNRIGGTLATKEIDEIPANFRNFTALTQLIPGMTPAAATSSFEGGQVTVAIASLPYKCPAAPYETAMLIDGYLRQRGIRGNKRVVDRREALLPVKYNIFRFSAPFIAVDRLTG